MSFSVRTLNDRPSRTKVWATRIAAVLTVAQPLLGLYGRWKKDHEREKRIGVLKRVLVVLVAVLAAGLLVSGVGKAMMSLQGMGISNVISVAGADLPTDEHGFTNILLLGQGHIDHDGKNLTDTIMVASIDPSTKSVVLLSIPRDVYFLHTENMGKGKLNSMYRDFRSYLIFQKGMTEEEASIEALKELGAEIGRKIDRTIHHVVKVDFLAFIKAVDTIGGVDIDVPYDIEDLEYPDEHFGYDPFIIQAGPRHLDGETALKYARSRHTTSDFSRSARQQQLLGAMAEKAKQEGMLTDPGVITSFMNIMQENVETTMTLRELIGAAELGKKIDRSNIITMQLNDRNALYDYIIEPGGMLYTPPRNEFDGASVLLPVSIPEFPVTWKQPKALVELLFQYRDVYLQKPTISLLNAGAAPGTARRLSNELIRYGFDVTTVENADSGKRDDSLIVATPEPDAAINVMTQLFAIPTAPAPAGIEAQRARVTMLLGRDFRYTPLQDLVENIRQPVTDSQLPITSNQ